MSVETVKLTQAQREKSMALLAPDSPAEPPNLKEALEQLGAIASPGESEAVTEFNRERVAAKAPESSGTIIQAALSDLMESPTNPRKRWGDLDELIKSVTQWGVRSPIIGRWVTGVFGRKIEIVVGHRRYRAAKQAGRETVPVDILDMSDAEVLELQAFENLQREDLHEMEEAEHYGRMLDAGYTRQTIALKIGKQVGWIHTRLKLLALGPEGRAAFLRDPKEPGAIPVSVAVPLARIPGHDIQAKALEVITRSPMTVRAMLEILQKEFCQNLKGAPFDLKDESLNTEMGSCTRCPENANNQPIQLFGDFEKGLERQGVCLKTICFEGKCREQFKRTAEKAKDQGAKLLSAAEARKIINHGDIAYQAPYVFAGAIVHEDGTKKRTWEQVIGKLEPADMPQLLIAPDDDNPGKMLKLFERDAAIIAARKAGAKWALAMDVATDSKKSAPTSGSNAANEETPEDKARRKEERAKEKAAKAKQEAVLLLTKLTIPKLVRDKWSTKAALPEMRVLAAELFAKAKIFEDEDKVAVFTGFEIPGAKEDKAPGERAIEVWIDKAASREELIAFCLVIVLYDKWTDTGDNFEDSFAELATAAGCDLKKGLRSQQETAALEAEKGRAAKK